MSGDIIERIDATLAGYEASRANAGPLAMPAAKRAIHLHRIQVLARTYYVLGSAPGGLTNDEWAQFQARQKVKAEIVASPWWQRIASAIHRNLPKV